MKGLLLITLICLLTFFIGVKVNDLISRREESLEAKLRQEITDAKADLRQEMGGLEIRLRQEIAEVRVSLAGTESRLVRWMFLFWVGTIGISILLKL